jgi:hypothetical protein
MMTGNLNLSASGDHYHISMVPKDDVERVAQCIRSQMAQVRSHPAQHAATTGHSIVEQIQQLATLRDQGILTDAEFEAKKADLLARM